MSKLLRGKKTLLKNFNENFTKTPYIILHAKGLTAHEKLILIELQSYSSRPNYILAYTRMANDLDMRKATLVEHWNKLKVDGYIQISDDKFSINYDALTKERGAYLNSEIPITYRKRTKIGTPVVPAQGTDAVPEIGTPAVPNVGTDAVPIEEEQVKKNKEEEESKNKEKEKAILKNEFEVKPKKEIETTSINPTDTLSLPLVGTSTNSSVIPSIKKERFKIKSIGDFKRMFNEEEINKFQQMGFNQFINSTNYLFNDSEYSTQTLIHQLLKNELPITPKKTVNDNPNKEKPKTVNNPIEVYDMWDVVASYK